jgi:hypothetical protein
VAHSHSQLKNIGDVLVACCFWLLAFGFWLLAFGIWLLAFGIWHLAFGIWHLAFGIWHLAFGFWLRYMHACCFGACMLLASCCALLLFLDTSVLVLADVLLV